MKVRILNERIRFRVSKDELADLADGKDIHSSTEFVSGTLKVCVDIKFKDNSIDFENNIIKVSLNSAEVIALNQTENVGFSFEQENLKVLFEKDFQCLTDRGEDESNLFANPKVNH